MAVKKVLIGQPYYTDIKQGSHHSARMPIVGRDDIEPHLVPNCRSSLLAFGFNELVATCNRLGEFDYFAMLHADISCPNGWLGVLIDEMEGAGVDMMHAVCAIKDDNGLTSTALAYSDNEWACVRRITSTELQKLPSTFDIKDINSSLDKNAIRLLPNTGCMVMRAGTWLEDFPGFCVLDRIRRTEDGDWAAEVIPEDWNFGHWCARNGISVGGTKAVLTKHRGEADYRNDRVWGQEVDWNWVRANAPADVWEETQKRFNVVEV